jgi:hypothetical protein
MKRIRKGVYFFEGSGGPIGGMPIKASVRTRTAGEPFASLPTTTVNMFWNIAGGILCERTSLMPGDTVKLRTTLDAKSSGIFVSSPVAALT